jgi:hypothetical protein
LLLYGALLTVLPTAPLLTAAGSGAGAGTDAHAGAGARIGTRAEARAERNVDPGHLQVYDANVENLPTPSENDPNPECAGDWHELMRYMQKRPLKPDVYVVQQLNDRDHLELLLKRMKEYFGEEYEGVLAENDPESQPAGDCKKYKHRQTNAVIWRSARFEQLLPDPALPGEWAGKRWQAQRQYTVQTPPPPTEVCDNNTQTRTRGVKVKLHDKVSGKDVTAASLHWPTGASEGPPCGRSNAGELSDELTEDGYGGADLYIAGGDTNTADLTQKGEWTDWYRDANGAIEGSRHHFRDAVHTKCGGSVDCLRENWTLWNPEPDPGEHRRRIDFLLGRKEGAAMPEMTDVVVPPLCAHEPVCEGELRYSDHRAVGARVHY